MERKRMIAANWKMNLGGKDAEIFIDEFKTSMEKHGCEVVICPPFTALSLVAQKLENTGIHLGAQNCHWQEKGAFTGEIAPSMLKEIGVKYVIIGHSERRQYFGETDETVNERIKAALKCGLKVILCVGESLDQREDGVITEFIAFQVERALAGIEKEQLENLVIAYEPIWAIGTGKTASSEDAQEVCLLIRERVSAIYDDKKVGEKIRILYGGSMNDTNAVSLLSEFDIDGGLIGSAALDVKKFNDILKATLTPQPERPDPHEIRGYFSISTRDL